MAGERVEIRGLPELNRAFAKFGKETRKELQTTLKESAEPVMDTARENVARQGLVKTGKTMGGFRVFYKRNQVGIRNVATNKGYPYPGIYEYKDGGARAFLHPALDARRGEVVGNINDMLDRLTDRFNSRTV